MRNLEETVEQIKRDRENRILSLWRTYLGSFEREIPIGTFRTFEAGYRPAGRTNAGGGRRKVHQATTWRRSSID